MDETTPEHLKVISDNTDNVIRFHPPQASWSVCLNRAPLKGGVFPEIQTLVLVECTEDLLPNRWNRFWLHWLCGWTFKKMRIER